MSDTTTDPHIKREVKFTVGEAWPVPCVTDNGPFSIELTDFEVELYEMACTEYDKWVRRFNDEYRRQKR